SENIAHVRILVLHGPVTIQVIEVISCAEGVVPAEPIGAAMKRVRSALRDNVNDGAIVTTELGHVAVRNDAKFFGRVRIQGNQPTSDAGNRSIVVVDAVQQEVIVAFACAIDGEAAQGRIALHGAGRKQNQLVRVLQNQGQALDLAGVHHVADLRRFQVDVGNGVSMDLHFLSHSSSLELHVESEDLVNGELDIGNAKGLETILGGGHVVMANRKIGHRVSACASTLHRACSSSRHIGDRDLCALYDGAALVGNGPLNGCGLCE